MFANTKIDRRVVGPVHVKQRTRVSPWPLDCISTVKKHMPIYEYRCEKCGRKFERLRPSQDADRIIECPFCESEDVERIFSSFATGSCGSGGRSRFR